MQLELYCIPYSLSVRPEFSSIIRYKVSVYKRLTVAKMNSQHINAIKLCGIMKIIEFSGLMAKLTTVKKLYLR